MHVHEKIASRTWSIFIFHQSGVLAHHIIYDSKSSLTIIEQKYPHKDLKLQTESSFLLDSQPVISSASNRHLQQKNT